MSPEDVEQALMLAFARVATTQQPFDDVNAARSALVREFIRQTGCLSPGVLCEAAELARGYARKLVTGQFA